MRVSPIRSEALHRREASFRALEQVIEDTPRLKYMKRHINDAIEKAVLDARFTVHVSEFRYPVGEVLRAQHAERIVSYFTQLGYYVESRPTLNTVTELGEPGIPLTQEGYFIAWDYALPSVRLMSSQ